MSNETRERAIAWIWSELQTLPLWKHHESPRLAVQIATSGSYRLGVHDESSDIDMVVFSVATISRQELTLAIKTHFEPKVNDLIYIEEAKVPLLSFNLMGVEFDLAVCILNITCIRGEVFSLLKDPSCHGQDEASELALGGPRHTQRILDVVGQTHITRFQNLLILVKRWAKARKLYGTKYGYVGGIGWNILCAFTCIHFPEADTLQLRRYFFKLFAQWDWRRVPVTLEQSTTKIISKYHAIHVITPCAPILNVTSAMSRSHVEVLTEEFKRAIQKINCEKLLCRPKTTWSMKKEFPAVVKITWQAQDKKTVGFIQSRLIRLCQTIRDISGAVAVLWPDVENTAAAVYVKPSTYQKDRREPVVLRPAINAWVQSLGKLHAHNFNVQLERGRKKRKRPIKSD